MSVATGTIVWRHLASPLAGLDEPEDVCVVRAVRVPDFAAVLVKPAAHGAPAQNVRRLAIDALDGDHGGAFARIRVALAGTAGASVAVVEVRPALRRFTLSAIGAITAVVVGSETTRFAGAPGIVGVGRPISPARLDVPWGPGSWAVVATDGLLERWELGRLAAVPVDTLDPIVRSLRARGRFPDDGSALILRSV
jgi:hypothetical protein